MNKQQIRIIAAMLAVAIAFGAFVLVKDRPQATVHAKTEEHADDAPEGHAEDGIVRFTDQQVASAGITLATAAPMRLDTFIRMPGQVALNEDRTAHVTPRAAGAVEAVPATLGQVVRKGEVLAVVASAEIAEQRAALAVAEKRAAYARSVHASEKTLWEEKISARQDYQKAGQELVEANIAVQEVRQKLAALGAGAAGSSSSNRLQVRAPFDGVVVEKHIALGEVVGADTRIFTVTDLATVWADVVVPAKDLDIVRVGTDAVIRSIASSTTAPGKVSFVSSLIGEESRSARARVVLANPQGAWRPGLAVNVDIVTGSAQAPVTVARAAIQTHEGRQVVYKRVPQGFVASVVETGRSDGRFVEIVSGLNAGDRYAAQGSFAIKAEQGKGEAGHHD
ncbi:efflux RND transporter periplasmic adaptor subunit [Telluria aromaticivorans]|uniref:Efflux RND transporter periplasmic adaptor subunit n=1 Tax=Telluria aromaticivorans TaxID=2725995 RepID=A0A7Y2JWA4_9BURK|nr:efflux RND transporter periplasmic adaptor subunit [Telluria aromaticivorans]NNG22207.1 efflux RND transporter periplasmic adaptor subunit [Telluria aromaticivorans]